MSLFYKNKNHSNHGLHAASLVAGFTLFEMLVSITIFTFLAAVLFVKNSQFEGTTVLTNLAYELALDIRQAQTYGLDVKAPGVSTASSDFQYPYGIDYIASADPNVARTFTLFADGNSDNLFDDPGQNGGDVVVQTTVLPGQYTIARVDGMDSSGNVYCTDTTTPLSGLTDGGKLSQVDISFKRPQPNANIYGTISGGSIVKMTSANIYIQSASGLYREVEVNLAGQISVNESPSFTSSQCNGQ